MQTLRGIFHNNMSVNNEELDNVGNLAVRNDS